MSCKISGIALLVLELLVLVFEEATEWIVGILKGGSLSIAPVGVALRRVLRMPCRGRFIVCPLVVAGLGLRYFVTPRDDRLGHPFKYPFLMAFSSVGIVGLHND